jgi:hypothetical protein
MPPEEYRNPINFFANTHPIRGLKDLLRNACLRLTGNPDQVASIFRLDTDIGLRAKNLLDAVEIEEAAAAMPLGLGPMVLRLRRWALA